jgi:hypothetical protein
VPATAVIELLMIGGKTPETSWAVNKRQDNKLENCCIWLVIYLNCKMLCPYRPYSLSEHVRIYKERTHDLPNPCSCLIAIHNYFYFTLLCTVNSSKVVRR